MQPLKISLVASEVTPFAKTGGLADVAAALPVQLARLGHDVRIVMPLYDIVPDDHTFAPIPELANLRMRIGPTSYGYSILQTEHPGGPQVYGVHCDALYARGSIYTDDQDEGQRFILLSRAAIEISQHLQWAPDILQANDWQTALIPLFLKSQYAWDRLFEPTRTVLSIHNIGYQGIFPATFLATLGLDDGKQFFDERELQHGRINFLRTGIAHADLLTTVSPTYAREIQTEEYGMGLEDILQTRSHELVGILNGIDEDEWHPRTDRLIPYRYSAKSLWRKAKNKEHLLTLLRLDYDKEAPLVGMVTRLTGQKGIELLFDVLPQCLAETPMRLVAVGSGEKKYSAFFKRLQSDHPGRVCFYEGYHNELAHLVEAASDMFLMPSRYEPCGLNQMYSLKYGTIPIVRKTGGLADTVSLFDPRTLEGTGFVFDHFTADGVRWALRTALATYRDKKVWRRLITNAMAEDFSWTTRAAEYESLYRRLVEEPRRVDSVSRS